MAAIMIHDFNMNPVMIRIIHCAIVIYIHVILYPFLSHILYAYLFAINIANPAIATTIHPIHSGIHVSTMTGNEISERNEMCVANVR